MRVAAVLLALGDEPVQEVDQRGAFGLVGLVLVEHQPAVTRNRGAVLAGRIHDRELTRRDVRKLFSGGRGAGFAWDHKVAVLVLERCLCHAGLYHVGELDVADRTRGLLDGRGHGLVAFGSLTNWPVDRLPLPGP